MRPLVARWCPRLRSSDPGSPLRSSQHSATEAARTRVSRSPRSVRSSPAPWRCCSPQSGGSSCRDRRVPGSSRSPGSASGAPSRSPRSRGRSRPRTRGRTASTSPVPPRRLQAACGSGRCCVALPRPPASSWRRSRSPSRSTPSRSARSAASSSPPRSRGCASRSATRTRWRRSSCRAFPTTLVLGSRRSVVARAGGAASVSPCSPSP